MVTELIKYKPFRDFLLLNFPKPKHVFQEKKRIRNSNPSLTGNSFEMLYTILTSKKHTVKKILSKFKLFLLVVMLFNIVGSIYVVSRLSL